MERRRAPTRRDRDARARQRTRTGSPIPARDLGVERRRVDADGHGSRRPRSRRPELQRAADRRRQLRRRGRSRGLQRRGVERLRSCRDGAARSPCEDLTGQNTSPWWGLMSGPITANHEARCEGEGRSIGGVGTGTGSPGLDQAIMLDFMSPARSPDAVAGSPTGARPLSEHWTVHPVRAEPNRLPRPRAPVARSTTRARQRELPAALPRVVQRHRGPGTAQARRPRERVSRESRDLSDPSDTIR